jgi:hypothetical protein
MGGRGRFINKAKAKAKIMIKSSENGRGSDPKYIWGQLYSLDNMVKFMAGIELHNQENPTQPITGVRMYYAQNARVAGGDVYPDLVLVGVDESDKDVPDLELKNKIANDDNILAGGLPCPNVCKPDTKLYLHC